MERKRVSVLSSFYAPCWGNDAAGGGADWISGTRKTEPAAGAAHFSDCFLAGFHLQLLVDVVDVIADGVRADVETVGDLLVKIAP